MALGTAIMRRVKGQGVSECKAAGVDQPCERESEDVLHVIIKTSHTKT